MAASQFFQCPQSGLRVQVFRHERAISYPPHTHSEMAIVICTEGTVESTQFACKETLYPGQLLFTNAGVPHGSCYCVDGKPTSGVTLEFDSQVLQRLGYNGASIYLQARFLGKMNLPEVMPLVKTIQDESLRLKQDVPLLVSALARQIMVLVLREWPRDLIRAHEWKPLIHLPRNELVRSIEIMGTIPVREFAVPELASKLHRSTSTFARLFTRSVGDSPHNFYLTTVLRQAANLLATTEVPVKEIALNLGFNSISHFSSSFRMKWNVTPTAFRQNAANMLVLQDVGSPPALNS
jgi:AraC-like DNA-binding protein